MPPEQQIERLLERGLSPEQAAMRMAAQMPIEEKRKVADEVIDCSGAMEETERQVNEALTRLRQAASPAK